MAFYKKYTKNNKGRGQGGDNRQETNYSRGGYHPDDEGRKGGQSVPQRKLRPAQRRFGPDSEEQQNPRQKNYRPYDKKQQNYGRPGNKQGGGNASFPPRGQSRPQGAPGRQGMAPGRRPGQRPFGRPATPPPARPFGGPAPAPVNAESAAEPRIEDNILVGRNPIREALRTGRDMEKLMVASGELSGSAREIVSMARTAGVKVQVVERVRLDQVTHHHQGMIAYASAYAYSTLDEILMEAEEKGEDPFIIILDRVTDPQNLGAIIRTAACVGAHGVLVQLHRAVGLTPSAVRASAGAVEHVKVARVTNINNSIRSLKERGIFVYGGDASGKDYRSVKITGPCALVIGSEGDGISPLTLSLCDEKLSIPMSGVIDSLNASVAAGILMYAAYTSRQK